MAKRILVADNDVSMITLIESLLKKKGFEVMTASDGQAAFELALSNPPDVAILDVMMPGMVGTEVARNLKENESTSRSQIILITALQIHTEEDSLGDYAVITKPFTAEELVSKIEELIYT
ncbi:MAG: response regulator [Candidatus Omnitrophica bacterium]|nr:response regulator [Candidatus Omnitrophota bacterium]